MKFGLNVKRRNVFDEPVQDTGEKSDVGKRQNVDKKTIEIISQAIEQDSDIFDYDKSFETFSSTQKKQDKTSVKKEARYIQGLIRASNKRKIDLEIANEKKIQREREEEGALFQDKEKFVTQAYLDKQQELLKLEKEEEEREAREKKDLNGFYRKILDERTGSILESGRGGDLESRGKNDKETVEKLNEIDEKSIAIKQAIETGVVILNDSEEIVDKRLYLKGGLNFTKKAEIQKLNIYEKDFKKQDRPDKKKNDFLNLKRRRDLESQKIKVQLEKEEEKSQVLESLKRTFESTVTDSKVQDAKARYLERKKLKE